MVPEAVATTTETVSEAAAEAAVDPLAHEVRLCGGGSARPYNRGRRKPRTETLVLGMFRTLCEHVHVYT